MMKLTMAAMVSMLMCGSGCIAQAGDVPEQAASTAQPAESITAADLPSSPSHTVPPAEGKETCADSCDQRSYHCNFEASVDTALRCATEFDVCMDACSLKISEPRLYPPVHVEPGSVRSLS